MHKHAWRQFAHSYVSPNSHWYAMYVCETCGMVRRDTRIGVVDQRKVLEEHYYSDEYA